MDLGFGKYRLDLSKEAWEKVDVGMWRGSEWVVWQTGS
jgi:hypothetical protein